MNRMLVSALLVAPALSLAAPEPAAQPHGAPAAAPSAPAPAAAKKDAPPETMFVYLTGEDGRQSKVPLLAESSAVLPVARVDSDLITVEDLTAALAATHSGVKTETSAGHKDFTQILDRMIDVRLLLLEGRDMGLDELPEAKQAQSAYEQSALLQALQHNATRDAKTDPAETERLYKQRVEQWKIRSVLLPSEPEAKAFVASMKGAKGFEEAAKRAVAEKKAKGDDLPALVSPKKIDPLVSNAVARLKAGGVTAPIKVKDGYTIVKLVEVLYPEDAKARADAHEESVTLARKRALKKYYDGLVKAYVKTDEPLLKSLDFEAKKPGLDALQKDERVLARIQGDKPITVGELAKTVKDQFFHGVERALKEKKVNRQKVATLDAMISQRIVPMEGRRLKLDETPEYKEGLSEFQKNLIFSAIVEKAVLPDVKVTDDEIKKYYEQHKKDFTLPAFYKLDSISFGDVKTAQAAVDKLKSGTDLKWLRQNAEGQVPEPHRAIHLDGGTVSANAMPADLVELLKGVKTGDYRVYPTENSQFHVIRVVEAIPPDQEPFDEAKEGIRKTLHSERVTKAIRDFAQKLRAVHPVKVYITKIGS